MKILIDADGCPVVNLAIQAAQKKNLKCLLFCDTSHVFNKEGADTVTVGRGADSADFVLLNYAQAGDIVVTQDYGLAAMALAKRALPISQDGFIYNDDNIDALLLTRYVAKKVRQSGGRLKGPSKRTAEQNKRFEAALQELLQNGLEV